MGKQTEDGGPAIPDAVVDEHLENVLRESGSGLRYFTFQKTVERMRNAMRNAMVDAMLRERERSDG